MGAAAASLSLGEAIGILQQWHSYNRDETWSRRGYDIGLQSMRIDILNTVREEMRDQVTVIISSLDNLMVVATLMLSIGFGFVVEGTFPPAEKDYDYDDIQKVFLVAYAILAALSLVFPLACLMLTIAARFEVELCQQDVMGDLQKHLLKALQRDRLDVALGSSREASSRLPVQQQQQPVVNRGRSAPALGRLPSPTAARGQKNLGEAVRGGLRRQLGNLHTLFYEDAVGQIAEDEVKLIAEGLLQKVNHYHFLYPIAQLFLWLGMLSSVLVCCVLLGLYYQANYPNTPAMWQCYSFILLVCAVGSVVFLCWMKFHMLREKQDQVRTKTSSPVLTQLDSVLSGVTEDSNAQPVFQSDAEVEAAYREAFGGSRPSGPERARGSGSAAGTEGDLEAFETAAEESDAESYREAPNPQGWREFPNPRGRPRSLPPSRSSPASLPGYPTG